MSPMRPMRATCPMQVHASRTQVIAVCKSADLLLMVLDATKPWTHREILTRELEAVGMRLNRCVVTQRPGAYSYAFSCYSQRQEAYMHTCIHAYVRHPH